MLYSWRLGASYRIPGFKDLKGHGITCYILTWARVLKFGPSYPIFNLPHFLIQNYNLKLWGLAPYIYESFAYLINFHIVPNYLQ